MPCRTDGYPEQTSTQAQHQYEQEVNHYRQETDRVTALLCAVMTVASGMTIYDGYENPECNWDEYLTANVENLGTWWNRHLEVDRQRREKIVAGALGKLGEEEQALLAQYFKAQEGKKDA